MTFILLRRISFAIALILGYGLSEEASAFTFSDIQNWTGTGSNEAALVIDWNDGKTPEALAWGFRWDGTATGLQMLQAIDAADPRLSLSYAYGGALVFSIGYDLNGNGGTFSPGTPGNETGSASDPSDHYQEGVFTKFWGYMNSATNPYANGGSWAEASTGANNRNLTNGAWDGWSLSLDETNYSIPALDSPVAAAAAVPEPAIGSFLLFGSVILGSLYRRR